MAEIGDPHPGGPGWHLDLFPYAFGKWRISVVNGMSIEDSW